MFIQVIQGHVSDKEEVKAALDRWTEQIAQGATGWLGTTAGVTDDGTFIGLARFESEDAARRNSDRHEQHQWWMETSKLFSGDVTFHDCTETFTYGKGGSDKAGFVQCMQGRINDAERMRTLTTEFDKQMSTIRPDVIGGITALHGDGGYTDCIYFTSEREARENESKELSPEAKAGFEEMMSLIEGEITYHDLKDPWLYSPR
jgi:hypothetical protein